MTRARFHRGERGIALYTAVFAVIVLVGLTSAMVMVSLAGKRERAAYVARSQRRYLAEAALADSLVTLTSGGAGDVATAVSPQAFGMGEYYASVVDNGDNTFTIDAVGTVGQSSRRLRCIARDITQGVFNHAMFAGNSDGDGSYSLDLGGTGDSADAVSGDIYSGGDIAITGDATATGNLRAGGTISGGTGSEGVSQPLPDIAGAQYETNHDINVKAEFTNGGPTYTYDELGGDAYQLPEDNPAHIFRLNPSDRSSEYLATTKDDYFLEDPYETVNGGSAVDADNSTALTLSGVGGEPGVDSNDKVYYIDGNLWLHNKKLFSLIVKHVGADIRITFVVKGNIYFSDNLLIRNSINDGVAFIAIKDSDVPDSGNIYFGDDVFGTLERMDAFMYAENNFYDTNLNSSGSTVIEVNGLMSAGNRVAIDRDHDNGEHTRLALDYDDRIATGALTLPGLPSVSVGGSARTMQVLSVFEVEGN